MSKFFEQSDDAESFLQVFHTPGLGYDSCVQEYNKGHMPGKYHESTLAVRYIGPRYCAEMLSGVYAGNPAEARVLDLAAGTGLVGQELRKRGFCNIDAHDGAAAMVEFCKATGFYNQFFVSFVGDGNMLPIEDDTYDAVTCCGATVENHLPPSAQQELVRVIKPGGFLVNAHRANLPEIPYGKQWRAEAQKLEDEGKWTLYGRLTFRNFNKYTDGSLDIYRVN
ncbi:demethylmenaquinone methyltransferase [Elysia marginata]|uniref:Demethylmenaquinone methyltransferase n=1 Tax=Elysia marginata TaxID=1093978 RepID=A0AAV4FTK3_9GAST|nr:demethylmenaquinone methyltransferase [Elysia marginata]